METIVIDANNFILQGVSVNDYLADAGYSPKSKGFNPLYTKGVLYPQPPITDISGIEGNVVASINDPNILGNQAYILDNEGKFYTLDESNLLTKRQTDGTRAYTSGTSDFIRFNGYTYATSETDIAQITGSNLSVAADFTWWTTTRGHANLNSSYRHPMEVVEDTLYIADANLIHTWDGTTSVPSAITLPNIWNITCMVKHPNGRDLIAFCSETTNYSHLKGGRAVAFIINTFSLEFTQEIPLDSQVEGARIVGGILYVTYGKNLGYFTETGIQFLRELEITLFGRELAYKHHLNDLDGHLLIVEDKNILAFGDLGKGKVFWYPITNEQGSGATSQNINSVLSTGNRRILYGTEQSNGTEKLFLADFKTLSTSGGPVFYTNRYTFPRKVWIRRIEVIHTALSGTGYYEIGYVNEDNSTTFIKNITIAEAGAVSRGRADCNIYTDLAQIYLQTNNNVVGLKKIIIYYEPAET